MRMQRTGVFVEGDAEAFFRGREDVFKRQPFRATTQPVRLDGDPTPDAFSDLDSALRWLNERGAHATHPLTREPLTVRSIHPILTAGTRADAYESALATLGGAEWDGDAEVDADLRALAAVERPRRSGAARAEVVRAADAPRLLETLRVARERARAARAEQAARDRGGAPAMALALNAVRAMLAADGISSGSSEPDDEDEPIIIEAAAFVREQYQQRLASGANRAVARRLRDLDIIRCFECDPPQQAGETPLERTVSSFVEAREGLFWRLARRRPVAFEVERAVDDAVALVRALYAPREGLEPLREQVRRMLERAWDIGVSPRRPNQAFFILFPTALSVLLERDALPRMNRATLLAMRHRYFPMREMVAAMRALMELTLLVYRPPTDAELELAIEQTQLVDPRHGVMLRESAGPLAAPAADDGAPQLAGEPVDATDIRGLLESDDPTDPLWRSLRSELTPRQPT